MFCQGKFQVSRFGKVKSIYTISKLGQLRLTGTILKTQVNDKGYVKVTMGWLQDGIYVRKKMALHRLVAMAWIPNPENKPEINHKDLNKLNNHYTNLEWVTPKENVQHAKMNGVLQYKIKYTDEIKAEIREQVRLYGVAKVAEKMGKQYQTIYNIATYSDSRDKSKKLKLGQRNSKKATVTL